MKPYRLRSINLPDFRSAVDKSQRKAGALPETVKQGKKPGRGPAT